MALEKNEKRLAGFSVLALLACGGGLVLVIVGLTIHFHNSGLSSLCENSALGQLAQSAEAQIRASCTHASTMSDLGIFLIIVGALVVLWGLKAIGGTLLILAAGERGGSLSQRESGATLSTKRAAVTPRRINARGQPSASGTGTGLGSIIEASSSLGQRRSEELSKVRASTSRAVEAG